MTLPDQLKAAKVQPNVSLTKANMPSPELGRFLYTSVGLAEGCWFFKRLSWTREQWLDWLSRDELELWVAYLDGTICGYFEMEIQPDGEIKFPMFGVLPDFAGRGIGGHMLTEATRMAWARPTQRISLDTCNLDSQHARAAYEARGFQVYDVTTKTITLPDVKPTLWPTA